MTGSARIWLIADNLYGCELIIATYRFNDWPDLVWCAIGLDAPTLFIISINDLAHVARQLHTLRQ